MKRLYFKSNFLYWYFLLLILAVLIPFSVCATSEDQCISTVVGFVEDDGPAINAFINRPTGIAVKNGVIYFADYHHHRIRKIQEGKISTVAGTGVPDYNPEPTPAIEAYLKFPSDVAIDSNDNIYIADVLNHCIRKVDKDNIITTYAGNHVDGYKESEDGGPADEASLSFPQGIAIDSDNNLYIADTENHCIRIVYSSNQRIDTYAGICENYGGEDIGDGDVARKAHLKLPIGVFVDSLDNLWIADSGHNRVRKIDNKGIIETIAGTGASGCDGEIASKARLDGPSRISIDVHTGDLYIADSNNDVIRKVDGGTKDGTITTYVGIQRTRSERIHATDVSLSSPMGLAYTGNTLFICDSGNDKILTVSSDRQVTVIAGDSNNNNQWPLLSAPLNLPEDIVFDEQGNMFIADSKNHQIKMATKDQEVITIAGKGEEGADGNDQDAVFARLSEPKSLLLDSEKQILYFSEPKNNWIRQIFLNDNSENIISRFVGNKTPGFPVDNSLFKDISIGTPSGLCFDEHGDIFFTDLLYHCIFKLDMASKTIHLIIGDNNTTGSVELLDNPTDLWIDTYDKIYIVDSGNNRVCKYDPDSKQLSVLVNNLKSPQTISGYYKDGKTYLIISDSGNHTLMQLALDDSTDPQIIAGISKNKGLSGDGGPADQAKLNYPTGIANLDSEIYFSDSRNNRIRKLSSDCEKANQVTTFAGLSYDTGTANETSINQAAGFTYDDKGNLYFSDAKKHRIRMIAANGNIKTIAGNGSPGYSGDGKAALNSQLHSPHGILWHDNNLYIADTDNHVIRLIDFNQSQVGIISTLIGNGSPGSEIVANLKTRCLDSPMDIAMFSNKLYICDSNNHRILKLSDGELRIVAGNHETSGYCEKDGDFATNACLNHPTAITFDNDGNLFIADQGNHRIRKIDSAKKIDTYAGTGNTDSASEANLYSPTDISLDSENNLYITDFGHNLIKKIDAQSKSIDSFIGNKDDSCAFEPQFPSQISLNNPVALIVVNSQKDNSQNLIFSDKCHRILQLSLEATNSKVNNFAGNYKPSYSGDDGPALSASFDHPFDVASDSEGNLYIADVNNNCIRKISRTGKVTTIAGEIQSLARPHGIAVDNDGNIYIADTLNHQILCRKQGESQFKTIVGTEGVSGDSIDSGPVLSALLNEPHGIAVRNNYLYICDTKNQKIRKIELDENRLETIATSENLSVPIGIAVDSYGNVYVSDIGHHKVFKIFVDKSIETYAGDGTIDYNVNDENKPATSVSLYFPNHIALDIEGNLYIADSKHNRIRKVLEKKNDMIITIAGNGEPGFSEASDDPTHISFDYPCGIDIRGDDIYIADTGNNLIRLISPERPVLEPPENFTCESTEAGIRLQWNITESDISAYWIEKSYGLEEVFQWVEQLGPEVNLFEDNSLQRSGKYVYRITAYSKGQFSDFQSCDGSIGLPILAVSPPGPFEVPDEAGQIDFLVINEGNKNVVMNWEAVSDQPWLTIIEGHYGVDGDTVIAEYSAYTGPTREATITITSPGSENVSVDVSVVQNLKEWHFKPVWNPENNPDQPAYYSMRLWVTQENINYLKLSGYSEISVFDGSLCVGAERIEGLIDQDPFIVIAMDSGDHNEDGAFEGHRISFRFWDEIREIDSYLFFNSCIDKLSKKPVECIFKGDADYIVNLIYPENNVQTINLLAGVSGFNHISFYLTFNENENDAFTIFKPLIDSNVLKKVSCGSQRLIPFNGNWIDNIKTIRNDRAYQVFVYEDAQLEVQGESVPLPFKICLEKDVNYIGFPVQQLVTARELITPLNDKLAKIINAQGKIIFWDEDDFEFTFTSFIPGEGYKIIMNTESSLTIGGQSSDNSSCNQRKKSLRDSTEMAHCTPVWSGNANNAMNLWITKIDGFDEEVGDSICVYDREKCVGAAVVSNEISTENYLIVNLSQEEPGYLEGFTRGQPISIKIWDASEEKEINVSDAVFIDVTSQTQLSEPTFQSYADYEVIITISNEITLPEVIRILNCIASPEKCTSPEKLGDAISILKALTQTHQEGMAQ